MIVAKHTTARQRQARICFAVSVALAAMQSPAAARAQQPVSATRLVVTVDFHSGKYTVAAAGDTTPVLQSDVAARVDGRWLHASDYPHHEAVQAAAISDLGPAQRWTVMSSGLPGTPDLQYTLDVLTNAPFAELTASLRNNTPRPVHLQAVRSVQVTGAPAVALGGSDADDRVLSDSFSEDHPQLAIRDLADTEAGVHRAVGSQLIYNRGTQRSLFLAALTSDRFLTFLNLHVTGARAQARTASLEVEATGMTDFQRGYSLQHASAEDQVEASIPLAPGETFTSEKLLIGVGQDYHQQLEQYGAWIKTLHHARTGSPSSMGWWSWTAYYFGLTEATAWSNAQWLAQHLKSLGYDFFHIDEGYQFARGEYATPDAAMFPHGLEALEEKVRPLGLVPGIWTAPFQVSERSWVYQHHADWLVANAVGRPLRLGFVTDKNDQLYVLDTTHPDAQQYLRSTYRTLVHDWGIRYIKLDFMDDAAIEGHYHRAPTTAIEAQTIGLEIIREAVGEDVLLDKDGSAMLNPVGIVDTGRISQDTGHTFGATRDAATGVAARYYMNRNFFVSDPDAFSVSRQVLKDQVWHGGEIPVSLDEAKASIALSAVAGGMYEIGDDLPRLSEEPERLALIENQDLISMALLGRASSPVDLMSYRPEDEQPTIFFLRETPRQSILTVFNWTDSPRTHAIGLASLGLAPATRYSVTDVLEAASASSTEGGVLHIDLPPHSVRVLKILSPGAAAAPRLSVQHVASAATGAEVSFTASPAGPDEAITSYTWDFGDGVTARGAHTSHAYTREGRWHVTVRAAGVEGPSAEDSFSINVSGQIPTTFVPARNKRQHQPE